MISSIYNPSICSRVNFDNDNYCFSNVSRSQRIDLFVTKGTEKKKKTLPYAISTIMVILLFCQGQSQSHNHKSSTLSSYDEKINRNMAKCTCFLRKTNEVIRCLLSDGERELEQEYPVSPALRELMPSLLTLHSEGHKMGPKARSIFLHATAEFPRKEVGSSNQKA